MKWSPVNKILFLLIAGILIIAGINFLTNNLSPAIEESGGHVTIIENDEVEPERAGTRSEEIDISELTDEKKVIAFLKDKSRLPDYYLTKRKARELGWTPEKGNLCKVLPGKAIGGDRFGNREGKLPKKVGRTYFEADINYDCGRRNADRLVYSNDGLIFITKDHYKSFRQL